MIVLAPVGALLILATLWDAFETMVLPRRVERRLRIGRTFYRIAWRGWRQAVRLAPDPSGRETLLGFFGPLAIIMLFAVWAGMLVVAFATLQWSLGSHLVVDSGRAGFGTDVYMSGTTFFTLGLGDVVPSSTSGRTITVIEAGTGFAFLALVIGYLPVLYQTFSRREVSISLLDARAGSPPTAGEMLRRHAYAGGTDDLGRLLLEWERSAADLLESHLSYPALAFFRSQHDRQSWISALAAILDASAAIQACGDSALLRPAQLAFAMARHAVVDLSGHFVVPSSRRPEVRLPASDVESLRRLLASTGLPVSGGAALEARLRDLTSQYDPYIAMLAEYFMMPLPPWLAPAGVVDDWQTTSQAAPQH